MSSDNKAPFSYEGLDRVIHEKARLGIMTSLIGHPKGLAFSDLKRLCEQLKRAMRATDHILPAR